MKILLLLLTIFLVSCSTAKKSSKPEYLYGGHTLTDKEDDVVNNLRRYGAINKKRPLYTKEKDDPIQLKKGYGEASTNVTASVYPLTEPLLRLRIKNNISEDGFKNQWDQKKIDSEIVTQTERQIKNLVKDRQCFAILVSSLAANSNIAPESTNMKYWYGDVIQEDKKEKITFEKGESSVTSHVGVYSSTYTVSAYSYKEYTNFALACIKNKINLGAEFSVVLDLRFQQDVLPLTLTWQTPKPTTKSNL